MNPGEKIALSSKELCNQQFFQEILMRQQGQGDIRRIEPDPKKRDRIICDVALLGGIKEIRLPSMGASERKRLFLNPEWKPNYSVLPEYVNKSEAAKLLGVGRTFFHSLLKSSQISDLPFEIRPNARREVVAQQKLFEWARSKAVSPANDFPPRPKAKVILDPRQIGLEAYRLLYSGKGRASAMRRWYYRALTSPHRLLEYARFAAPAIVDLDECVSIAMIDPLCAVQFAIELRDYRLLTDPIQDKLQAAAYDSIGGIFSWIRLISQAPTDISIAVRKMTDKLQANAYKSEELRWVEAMSQLDCLQQNEKDILKASVSTFPVGSTFHPGLANPLLERLPEPVFDYRSVYCDDDLLQLMESGADPIADIARNSEENPYYVWAKLARGIWKRLDEETQEKEPIETVHRSEVIQSEISRRKADILEIESYVAKLQELLNNDKSAKK